MSESWWEAYPQAQPPPRGQGQAGNWWDAYPVAPQQPAQQASPLRRLGMGTRDVIEGAAALPGVAYDAAGAVLNEGLNAAGMGRPIRPARENIGAALDAIGLPRPETQGERITSGVVRGAAGAIPGVGLGMAAPAAGVPALAGLARQPAMQATAGAVGGGVEQATDSHLAGTAAALLTPRVVAGAMRVPGAFEGTQSRFNRTALQSAGIEGNRATSEVLDAQHRALGRGYDQLYENNALDFSTEAGKRALQEVRGIADEAKRLGLALEQPVLNRIRDLINKVDPEGKVPGRVFGALSSDLGRAIRRAAPSPQLQHRLGELDRALKDAWQSSLPEGDAARWGELNRQFGNLMTLETAAGRLGAETAGGNITPQALAGAQQQAVGARNYARGRGGLTPLARAGERYMRQPSPTVRALQTGPGVLGAATGLLTGNPAAAAGGVIGAVAPEVYRGVRARVGMAPYLAPAPVSPLAPQMDPDLIAALLAQQAAGMPQ